MKYLSVKFCSAFIAAVVAIGLNFADDQQSFRKHRATKDVRTASLAVEAFKIDEGACPTVQGVVTTDEIAHLLEPVYVATLPRFDTWGNPLRYWMSDGNCWVASYGPDDVADEVSQSGDDIRFKNGEQVDVRLKITDDFRQRRATEDVRTASLAVEAFKIDEGACPTVQGVVTTDEIAHLLEPVYVATLPRFDTWGNPLRYWMSDGNCWVASYGPDDVADDVSQSGDDIRFKNGGPFDE